MDIRFEWFNTQQTILRLDVQCGWTLDNYRTVMEHLPTLLSVVPHQVHIIVDFSATRGAPPQFLTYMRQGTQHLPQNQGAFVVVGASDDVKLTFKSFKATRPELALYFARDMAGALTTIKHYERNLVRS